jgi:hypothetical protein
MLSLAVYIVLFLLALAAPIYYGLIYHDKDCEVRYEQIRQRTEQLKAESSELLVQINALRDQDTALAAHYDKVKDHAELVVDKFPAFFFKGVRGLLFNIDAKLLAVDEQRNVELFELYGDDFSTLRLSLAITSVALFGPGTYFPMLTAVQGETETDIVVSGDGALKLLVYLGGGNITLAGWPTGKLINGDRRVVGRYSPTQLPTTVRSTLPAIKILTSKCTSTLDKLIECLHSPNSES